MKSFIIGVVLFLLFGCATTVTTTYNPYLQSKCEDAPMIMFGGNRFDTDRYHATYITKNAAFIYHEVYPTHYDDIMYPENFFKWLIMEDISEAILTEKIYF